jgi:hypothetical protein
MGLEQEAKARLKIFSRSGELLNSLALKDGVYLLGRGASCDILCEGASNVSRRHAELRVKGRELRLRDLDSKLGTFVNGRKILEASLADGDLFQLGMMKFLVELPSPSERASADVSATSIELPVSGGAEESSSFFHPSVCAPRAGRLEASLNLFTGPALLPLAQSFAESSALAFGLDSKAALSLALAAEEIFMHLCESLPEAAPLELRSDGRGGRASLEFRFNASASLDLSAFNISSCSPDAFGLPDLKGMGLLLAARSVDELSLLEEPGGATSLRLLKERSYPESKLPAVASLGGFAATSRLRAPELEELPAVSALAKACAAPAPAFLLRPAQLADLLHFKQLSLLAAFGPDGALCGAIAWSRLEPGRALECFGPFVAPGPAELASKVARALQDALLAEICKGDAPLLIARTLDPAFAAPCFEELPGGEGKAFFRLLGEDEGSALWISPCLESYARDAVKRLYLPRFVTLADPSARPWDRHSVLFSSLDRKARRALLRPLRPGLDAKDAFVSQVAALRREGFEKISCVLDLGVPWHCLLGPALLESGFAPGVFLPSAGVGDLLLMDFTG